MPEADVGGPTVFLAWHDRRLGQQSPKLLGVSSSLDQARAGVARAQVRPGFLDHPEDFIIEPYTLDRDNYPVGFTRVAAGEVESWGGTPVSSLDA